VIERRGFGGRLIRNGSEAAVDSVLDHYLGSVPEQEEALG